MQHPGKPGKSSGMRSQGDDPHRQADKCGFIGRQNALARRARDAASARAGACWGEECGGLGGGVSDGLKMKRAPLRRPFHFASVRPVLVVKTLEIGLDLAGVPWGGGIDHI